MQVPSNDPAIDVDSLGVFAGAKLVQNQVLLDAYLETAQDAADSFQDSILETPLKKTKKDMMNQDIDFHMKPPEHDAADEQVVNQALISFASALTRRWMIQQAPTTAYANEQTPTRGGGTAVPPRDWKTVADWTMARDRFHIRERRRNNDRIQTGHMEGLMASKRKDKLEVLADNHSYVRVLTSETDGSLYRIGASATEVLAIVEAKKRLRRRNRLKIEWQEAAEILAWLNVRLRAEIAGKGKGLMTERRGMLEPKPAAGKSQEKSRCLLVAQDREEMHLVIGEWDALYEEYALEGKFSDANIKVLEKLKATRDPARADAGFLTLHVYGPFGGYTTGLSSRNRSMRKLSANLLALSLHLNHAAQAAHATAAAARRPLAPLVPLGLSRKAQSLAEEKEKTAVAGLGQENPAPKAQHLVLAKIRGDTTRRPRGTSAPVRRDLTSDARPQSGTSQFLDLSRPRLMTTCHCGDVELPSIRRAARAKPVPNLAGQNRGAEMLLQRDITASRQQLQRQCRRLLPCLKPPAHLYRFRVNSSNTKANGLIVGKQLRGCNHTATNSTLQKALVPNSMAPQHPPKRTRTYRNHKYPDRRPALSINRPMILSTDLGLLIKRRLGHRHSAPQLGLLYLPTAEIRPNRSGNRMRHRRRSPFRTIDPQTDTVSRNRVKFAKRWTIHCDRSPIRIALSVLLPGMFRLAHYRSSMNERINARCAVFLAANVRRMFPDTTDGVHTSGTESPATLKISIFDRSPENQTFQPLNDVLWLQYTCYHPTLGRAPKIVGMLRQTSRPVTSVQEQLTSGLGSGDTHLGFARLIGQNQIDTRLFGEWLRLCDSKHRPQCNHSVYRSDVPPRHLRVVNIREKRVVLAPPDCQYVALSYLWGPVDPLRLTVDNAEMLGSKRALDLPHLWSAIPRTVRDAMPVALAANIEYLWVDTLCISQDDFEIKQEMFQQMHLVYRNATFTIAVWELGGRTYLDVELGEIDEVGSGFQASAWRTRVWTYEEGMFSSRMLVFTEQQAYWCCPSTGSGGWREDIAGETTDIDKVDGIGLGIKVPGREPSHGDEHFDLQPRHNFGDFQRYANEYSRRDLTRPHDALNAFMLGIESSLREVYSDFFWGIPERDFVRGLCWFYPGAISGSAQHKLRAGPGLSRNIDFPRWSWVNWRHPSSKRPHEQWKRGALYIWGVQFRGHEGSGLRRCATFYRSDAEGRVAKIGESRQHSRRLQKPQNDLHLEEQGRHNDEVTSALKLEANILKCHTETATVFVVCLENRLLRTLQSVRQNAPADDLDYDGLLWKEMPSGFVLQSAPGHLLATPFVAIEDDSCFLDAGTSSLDIAPKQIKAVVIARSSYGGCKDKLRRELVICLLTVEDTQGYSHRIGLAEICEKDEAEIVKKWLEDGISYKSTEELLVKNDGDVQDVLVRRTGCRGRGQDIAAAMQSALQSDNWSADGQLGSS
ncbi:hypothetical protein LA080_000718 [Diaporthe eres]|nr:hypothetical protein LA080_000718 [Diaporthe eres]